MLPYRRKLKNRARELRSSMTDAETVLWTQIRRRQLLELQFLRQRPIGGYIVDFYCPEAALVVEIDGGQHYTTEGKETDEGRDNYLKSLELSVLRFSSTEVLNNIDGVVLTILQHLESSISDKTRSAK